MLAMPLPAVHVMGHGFNSRTGFGSRASTTCGSWDPGHPPTPLRPAPLPRLSPLPLPPSPTTASFAAAMRSSVASMASHALGCTMSYEGMAPFMVTTTKPVAMPPLST